MRVSITTRRLDIPGACTADYQLLWWWFLLHAGLLSDIFGVRQLASIHGSILTAWGIAGVAGPVILAVMKENTGGYTAILQLFAGLLALAFLVSAVIQISNIR